MAATGWSRAVLASDTVPSAAALDRFRLLVARRVAGEPLQYLEGTAEFGPVTLRIDGRALIPRPETEQLYERVAAMLGEAPPDVIVDIGTGCGNLALALKHDFPSARVLGCDIDEAALRLAMENGAESGLDVEWRAGDLFGALPGELRGSVDVVVSNPPYIADPHGDVAADVVAHEPHRALFAGPDGLGVLSRIAADAGVWLAPGGLIACEIGADQSADALRLFRAYAPTVGVDLSARPRWVIGRRGVGRDGR